MLDLPEIIRSLSDPLTPARLAELEALLPELEAQLQTSRQRIHQVMQQPGTRRKRVRGDQRIETQREALREIQAYITTLELTIAHVQRTVSMYRRVLESHRFASDLTIRGDR
jgi:flagellar biosynthesis chaperone FliJ